MVQVTQRLRALMVGKREARELQVGVWVCRVNGQDLKECVLRLCVLPARQVMIAEIVPQTGRPRREFQRALMECFCFCVILLRIQDQAKQAQQVRPVRLARDGRAQLLFGSIKLALLEGGSRRDVNVLRFGLRQHNTRGCVRVHADRKGNGLYV